MCGAGGGELQDQQLWSTSSAGTPCCRTGQGAAQPRQASLVFFMHRCSATVTIAMQIQAIKGARHVNLEASKGFWSRKLVVKASTERGNRVEGLSSD